MTINSTCDNSFDLDSNSSDCDSGHLSSDDFPLTPEEVQEIYDDLDLDEEGITEDEILRRKTRIFVGGLKFASEDVVLTEYFKQFGKIKEAVVIRDRKTGDSKGYGFVTMFCHMAALKAIIDKSPKLDGRRCNVNLAYAGQKNKPPSKKPDLKLRDLSPLQSQVFNYSSGYMVSPTIVTPTGHYYQLGLPPLHGHQPVYHIPPSPSHCYEPCETYVGQSPIPPPSPMSPMSPIYQQPVYYSHPVMLGNHNMAYPPPSTVYQTCTTVSSNDLNNNNNKNITMDNNNNNNNNNFIPQNNAATTTVVPSTYGLVSSHQQTPYSPAMPISISSNMTGGNGSTTFTGVATETRPLLVNSKVNTTPVHGVLPTHVVNNNSASTSNIAVINNASVPVTHQTAGSVHLMNGGAILHPHIVGVPAHNVSPSTFVTSPLSSPSMQSPNQAQIFHQVPNNMHQGTTFLQQREPLPI